MPTIIRATDRNRGIQTRGVQLRRHDRAGRPLPRQGPRRGGADRRARRRSRPRPCRQSAARPKPRDARPRMQAVEQMVAASRLATRAAGACTRRSRTSTTPSRPGCSTGKQSAVHVAAAIAARVIRRELTRQPEITLTLVREALELAAGSSQVRIHLNPDDHQALAGQVEIAGQRDVELARRRSDRRSRDHARRLPRRNPLRLIDQQFESQLATNRGRIDVEIVQSQTICHPSAIDLIANLESPCSTSPNNSNRIMPTALTGSVAQDGRHDVSAAGFPAPVGAVAEIQRRTGRAAAGRGDRLPRRPDGALSA